MASTKTSKRKIKKVTIAGIIIPAGKNKTSTLNRISIRTPDGKEYLIDYSGVGKELVTLINRKVEINGELRQRLDGQTIISINTYKIFKGYNEKEEVSI